MKEIKLSETYTDQKEIKSISQSIKKWLVN